MKRTVITIIASILSGIYWFCFFLLAETWTASDYRAGSEPNETFVILKMAVVLVSGPVIFALLIVMWRKLEAATGPEADRA